MAVERPSFRAGRTTWTEKIQTPLEGGGRGRQRKAERGENDGGLGGGNCPPPRTGVLMCTAAERGTCGRSADPYPHWSGRGESSKKAGQEAGGDKEAWCALFFFFFFRFFSFLFFLSFFLSLASQWLRMMHARGRRRAWERVPSFLRAPKGLLVLPA